MILKLVTSLVWFGITHLSSDAWDDMIWRSADEEVLLAPLSDIIECGSSFFSFIQPFLSFTNSALVIRVQGMTFSTSTYICRNQSLKYFKCRLYYFLWFWDQQNTKRTFSVLSFLMLKSSFSKSCCDCQTSSLCSTAWSHSKFCPSCWHQFMRLLLGARIDGWKLEKGEQVQVLLCWRALLWKEQGNKLGFSWRHTTQIRLGDPLRRLLKSWHEHMNGIWNSQSRMQPSKFNASNSKLWN